MIPVCLRCRPQRGNKNIVTFLKRFFRFLVIAGTLYIIQHLLKSQLLPISSDNPVRPGSTGGKYFRKTAEPTKIELVIGIPSSPQRRLERNAVRETWLSLARYALFDIKYKFILDNVTTDSEKENSVFHDIIYSNISVYGYANENSRRLRVWFKHALKYYPSAEFIGKMDDDVYVCTPQIFDRIYRIKANTMVYGHRNYWTKHAGISLWYDEMFIIVARQLVEQYVNEDICHNKEYSVDACNYADIGIEEWRQRHKVNISFHHDNRKMVHFDKLWPLPQRIEQYKYARLDYCKNNLLYHKSSLSFMYKFYHFNKGMSETEESKLPKFVKFHINNIKTSSDHVSCRYWFVGLANFKNQHIVRKISSCKSCCQVLVADEDSPTLKILRKKLDTVNFEKIFYISIEAHENLFPALSDALPWNHFGRRNIGYMFAIQHGAEYVADFHQPDIRYMNLSALENAHNMSHIVNNCGKSLRKVNTKNIHESWPMFVEDLKSISQNICIEMSKNNIGLLHFVPVSKTFFSNREKTFLRYLPSKDLEPSKVVYFWHKSILKYIPLTIASNEAYSTSLRELISLYALERNGLQGYYVPLPQETTGIGNNRNVAKPLISGRNITRILTKESSVFDLNAIYESLFEYGYVGYDDITLIRAWTATIESMIT